MNTSKSSEPTKVQLLFAVRDALPNGVSGLHDWLPPSSDDNNNIAFYHGSDAGSLYPVLLAYMQTPEPSGLGMSRDTARSKLEDLIRAAR